MVLYPLPRLDPAALQPFLETESFESFAVRALLGVESAEARYTAAHTELVGALADDPDAALGAALHAAIAAAADIGAPIDETPIDDAVRAGNDLETIHEGMTLHLPPADTPIDLDPGPPPDHVPVDFRDAGEPPPREPETPPGAPPPSREAQVRRQVRQLYLDLLGREPDEGGWAGWTGWVLDGGMTIAWVADQIRASDEYRATRGG